MYYKTLFSAVILFAFLSCSPDQEVLQTDQVSEQGELSYRILDRNDFSKAEFEKIENAVLRFNEETADKTKHIHFNYYSPTSLDKHCLGHA